MGSLDIVKRVQAMVSARAGPERFRVVVLARIAGKTLLPARLSCPGTGIASLRSLSLCAAGKLAIKCLKSIRWMPWRREAMKDVVGCDKPWGAANKL